MFCKRLTACAQVASSSGNWTPAMRDKAYSLKPEDYPRLPLFCRMGPAGSVALLNTVFCLVFDELSTWRSMSRLYCNVSDMPDLASSMYPASPAALGGVCPALSAVPKISRNLVAYLAGLIVVTQYMGGTADPRANGIGEVHADVVHKTLKMVGDQAYYYDFLKRKLVDWYASAPATARQAPGEEGRTERALRRGEGMGGCGPSAGVRDAFIGVINHCNLISRPERTDTRRERAAGCT